MPKWDIDKALKKLELLSCQGTMVDRVMVGKELFKEKGLKLKPNMPLKEAYVVWSLGLGSIQQPKIFFYGFTIREAYLKAVKAYKSGKLRLIDGWGRSVPVKPKKTAKKPVWKKKVRE